jgi:uncharacterized protein (DUF1778 family)
MSVHTQAQSVKLEADITPALYEKLKQATEIQGCTLTDFVVSAVQDAVHRAIEHTETIHLSPEAQKCFVDALLSPPEPGEALKRAFVLNDQLLRDE